MIPDWYFCNCIGLQAEQIRAFLNQLDVFDNPNVHYAEAGRWALPAALRALAKSDPWRQLYALPRVLRARRTGSETKHFEKQLADYIDALVALLPEHSPDMDELVEYVLRGRSRGAAAEAHAAAAIRALRSAASGETRIADRDGPYLDSDAFAPEVIVLACLADDLILVQTLRSTNGPALDAFLAEALAGAFGRLAFGLALDISAEETNASTGIEVLLGAKGCPLLEPDLCFWLARHVLKGEQEPEAFVHNELAAFDALFKYQDRWAELLPNTGNVEKAAVRRLRLENRPEVVSCWKLVCWQWALATAMAQIDAVSACRIFGIRWQPRRTNSRPRIIRVSQSAMTHRAILAANLAASAQQLNMSFEHPPPREGAPTSTEGQRNLLSPWHPEGLSISRRPDSGTPDVVWLSNLAGVFAAAQILTRLGSSSDQEEAVSDEAASLADLIASTFLIVRKADAELSARRNRERQRPLDGLVRFAHNYLERLGRSYYGNLERSFLHPTQKCAPAACIHWFEENLFEHGTGRSSLMAALAALRALRERGPLPPQQYDALDKACLLLHFVLDPAERGEMSPHDFVSADELRSRAEGCARKIESAPPASESERLEDIGHDSHRVLLMLDAAEIERLFGFALKRPARNFKPFRARLSLGILGFLTAIRLPNMATADRLDVISMLVELLAASTSQEAIDAYVADRLVAALQATSAAEVVGDASLAGPLRELREAITLAILEYGRSTQVARVVDTLFDVNDPSREQSWLITSDLRPAALAGFLSLVRSAEDHIQGEDEDDPWNAVEHRGRLDNLRRELRGTLSSALYKVQNGLGGGAVLDVFRHWLQQRAVELIDGLSWTQLSGPHRGKAEAERFQPALFDCGLIVDRSDGEVFALQSDRASWPDGSINIASCRLPDVVNGFIDGEIRPKPDNVTTDVLGIVCEHQPLSAKPGAHATLARLRVNIGSDTVFGTGISASRLDQFPPGSACIVSVTANDRGYIVPARHTEPRPVRPPLSKGQILQVRVVAETTQAGTRSVRVKWQHEPYLPEDIDILQSGKYLEHWMPDASWCLNREETSSETEWTCLAEITADGDPQSLKPVDNSFEALLIEEFAAQREKVLCFAGLSDSGAEWRFSTRPGRNYLIDPSHFIASEREAVAASLTGEDGRGLLLRLSWEHREGALKLLERDGMPPVDDRNRRWRELFEESEHLLATHDGIQTRGWVIELPETKVIDGFPTKLRIGSWKDNNLPGPGTTQVEVVADWSAIHQRTAVVTAGALAQAWRLPGDRNKALDLLRRIGSVCNGALLELRKPPGAWPRSLRPENNLYPYWAEGGVPVEVEPESITLAPWSEHYPRERELESRRVRVSNGGFFPEEPIEVEGELGQALPDAAGLEELRGILTEIPSVNAKLNLCTVHWVVGNDYQVRGIRIRDFQKLRRCRLGSVVIARKGTGGWHFRLARTNIRCEALWRHAEAAELGAGTQLVHAGDLPAILPGMAGRHVLEVKPGRFTTSATKPPRNSGHGPTEQSYRVRSHHQGTRQDRLTLEAKNRLLCGEVEPQRAKLLDQTVRLRSTELRLHWLSDGWFSISRKFDLAPVDARAPQMSSAMPRPAEEALRDQVLRQLASRRVLVPARPSPDGRSVTISSSELRREGLLDEAIGAAWSRVVTFPAGEEPFVPFGAFVREQRPGWVVLGDTAGVLTASSRNVRERTVEEFAVELSLSRGDVGVPSLPLYYAGIRQFHYQGSTASERTHIFEWGLGQRIELPENRLRSNGNTFDSVELTLLLGDEITAVLIDKDVVDIKGYRQSMVSDLHELAEQANDQMLHIVELSWEKNILTINAVRGLNRRASGDDHSVRFRHIRPTISMVSQQVLLPALSPNARFSVIARLNPAALRQSGGTVAQFDIVDRTTDTSQTHRIRIGDIVFLCPTKVRRESNDVILELTYPVEDNFPLLPAFVPTALKKVEITRRRFSAREDRLGKLAELLERRQTLLIPVAIVDLKGGTTRGALVNGDRRQVMTRHESVLAAALREPSPTYAIVLRHDRSGLELELKIGVFVSLANNRFEIAGPTSQGTEALRKGTIVYVKTRDEPIGSPKFTLTPTSSADHAFIPRHVGRLAVGLPTNPMFNPRILDKRDGQQPGNATAQRQATISIGDLPNIIATPDSHVDDTSITAWMNRPHPKLVWLRRRYDNVTFSPAETRNVAGDISVAGVEIVGELPVLVPVRCTSATGNPSPAPDDSTQAPASWLDLTFADQSATAVASAMLRGTWSYHDQKSAMWVPTESGPEGRSFPLAPHSSASGPLNFVVRNNVARLRYSLDDLDRVGLPTDVLLDDLERADGTGIYFIAHPILSADNAAMLAPPRGLWIEVSPGRVAELPGALCQWQTDAGPIALDEFAWGKFATGDIVRLELLRDDNPMMPDRIRVAKWQPGIRGALGTKRAFLPVVDPDVADGALRLGAGRWQLTLPVAGRAFAGTVVLNHDNGVLSAENQTPGEGDSVLLTLADEQIRVSGFDNWRVTADVRSPWVGTNPDLFGKADHLVELLRLCGGSVPVQVTEWRAHDRVCMFARGNGLDHLPERQLVQGQIVGWHHGLSKVVVSIGAGLWTMSLREVVSGAADRWGPAVCEALLRRNEPVWFKLEDRKPLCGFRPLTSEEFEIAPLETIAAADEGDSEFGILCRIFGIGRFVWVAAENASLAGKLSRGDFDRALKAFRSPGAQVLLWPARFAANDEATVIGSRRIVEAFKRTGVGSSLTIRFLAYSADNQFQLGADPRSNIFVRCTGVPSLKIKINDPFTAEVAALRKGRMLEVVPEGTRRVPFDLTREMLDWLHTTLDPRATDDVAPGIVPESARTIQFVRRIGLAVGAPTLQVCLQEAISLSRTNPKASEQLLFKTGLAALRSHHIVALTREWKSVKIREQRFWRQRATRLLREIFGKERHEGVTPAQIARIRYLLTSVAMRERMRPAEGNREPGIAAASAPLLVATALAASAGLRPPPELWLQLIASNIELNTFLSWFRMYPTATDQTSRIDLESMEARVGLSAHLETGWYSAPLLQPFRLS